MDSVLLPADSFLNRSYMGYGSNFAKKKNYGGRGGRDIRHWSKRVVIETSVEAVVT